ncbi:nuclear transport factor 2 family protein [Jiella sp. MQZ9-1]|uniref:Nuclear transport factor 2 family protein n=1 Tax=Jiella flava TaxID=2816857 RepID=A0A939JW27_9HYPH|nr:ketosteroid isomerase-related protein [Jiella flava]MBO0662602.1 nuclear transport factor 2 family protein [Jiella flava]MCD2471024.1 nuclear transport factor 2 family protein [Jiella flava]
MTRAATETLIHRYLEAFNTGDLDTMFVCLDEDVAHDVNEGEREIGREAFRRFMAAMHRHYDETLADIVVFASEDGSRAAAEFTVRGRYIETAAGLPEASHQAYSIPAGQFFTIDDGKISRLTTYYNLKAWIAAVSKA